MNPGDPKELSRMAREAQARGDTREASANFAAAAVALKEAGDLPGAKSHLAEALRLTPASPRLYVQLALCEEGEGNPESADRAMALFSRHVLEKRSRFGEYRRYLESRCGANPRLRLVFYDRLIELDRTDAAAFLAKARAHEELGNQSRALRALVDGLKTRTREREVIEALDGFAIRAGNPVVADLIKENREDRLSRADLVARLETVAMAPPATSRPAPRTPASPEADKSLAQLVDELERELGVEIEDRVDNVVPLVREFRRRSDALVGHDSRARRDLAMAFFEMGLREDALEELAKIPATDPLYPETRCLAGTVLLAAGGELGALEAFRACLRDDRAPLSAKDEAVYQLVGIYTRLGDVKQALELALELERRSPQYRDIHRMRVSIEEWLGVGRGAAAVPGAGKKAVGGK